LDPAPSTHRKKFARLLLIEKSSFSVLEAIYRDLIIHVPIHFLPGPNFLPGLNIKTSILAEGIGALGGRGDLSVLPRIRVKFGD
jgi:hypothetical protein